MTIKEVEDPLVSNIISSKLVSLVEGRAHDIHSSGRVGSRFHFCACALQDCSSGQIILPLLIKIQ